jgi:hypothetical protein
MTTELVFLSPLGGAGIVVCVNASASESARMDVYLTNFTGWPRRMI